MFGADDDDDEIKKKPPGGPPQSPHDSLFLTWQGDPTTTMTVQWIGEAVSDEDSLISYAKLKGKVWQTAKTIAKPFPMTKLHVLRSELTGLEPAGEYRFRVGQRDEEYRFRTMPAKATDEICFVSGGDSGIGAHADLNNALAAKQDPQFVLMAGDLAYDNNEAPKTVLKFFQNYSKSLVDSTGRIIPLVACFGNHEVKGGYKGTRAKAASFLSLFDGFFSETTYGVLDIGDYMSLVLLDSGHVASIEGEQTAWLEKTLAERQDRQHLLRRQSRAGVSVVSQSRCEGR